MPRTLKRIAIAVGALVCALALAEVALAVLGLPDDAAVFAIMGSEAHCFRRDPDVLWKLRDDVRTYRPNRVGLRGYWPPEDAADPTRFRVVCVGDSSTFGVGYRYEDGYGAQLETLLEERSPGVAVEVMLAALPAFSSRQDVELYERHVRSLKPDVVVLYLAGWNDSRPAVGPPDAEFIASERAFAASLLSGSRIVRTVRDAMVRQRAKATPPTAQSAVELARRVSVDEFATNALRLLSLAREDGARPVLLLPPMPAQTRAAYPIVERYLEALKRITAEERDLAIVDGVAALDRRDAEIPEAARNTSGAHSPCYLDFVHPSALGHRTLAMALADEIGPVQPRAAVPTRSPARIESIARRTGAAGEIVEVRGRGFDSLAAADRVWLGRHWQRRPRVVSDGLLVLELSPFLPAGEYTVAIKTASGVVRSETTKIPSRRIAISAAADRRTFRVDAGDCPPSHVRVLFSDGRADTPRTTTYGAFHLLRGDPDGAEAVPVRWGELALPALTRDWSGGALLVELTVENPLPADAEVFAQALVVDPLEPFEGFLTAVSRVGEPR